MQPDPADVHVKTASGQLGMPWEKSGSGFTTKRGGHVKDPEKYEKLRAKGMSKEKAAAIVNKAQQQKNNDFSGHNAAAGALGSVVGYQGVQAYKQHKKAGRLKEAIGGGKAAAAANRQAGHHNLAQMMDRGVEINQKTLGRAKLSRNIRAGAAGAALAGGGALAVDVHRKYQKQQGVRKMDSPFAKAASPETRAENKKIKQHQRQSNIGLGVGAGLAAPLVGAQLKTGFGRKAPGKVTRALMKPKVAIPLSAASIGGSLYSGVQSAKIANLQMKQHQRKSGVKKDYTPLDFGQLKTERNVPRERDFTDLDETGQYKAIEGWQPSGYVR